MAKQRHLHLVKDSEETLSGKSLYSANNQYFLPLGPSHIHKQNNKSRDAFENFDFEAAKKRAFDIYEARVKEIDEEEKPANADYWMLGPIMIMAAFHAISYFVS